MARHSLSHGAWVEHTPAWLPPVEASQAMDALVRDLAWEQRDVVLFGKRIPQPRLIAWAGALGYRYSGQTLEPRDAPVALRALLDRVVGQTRCPFNHVLVNRYRDGHDSMGLHADDEPELGDAPVVASLSLGATRRFVVVSRRAPKERFAYSLGHGDLLVMGGTFQEHYRHGVPKEAGAAGERVSLTFRRLLRPPGV